MDTLTAIDVPMLDRVNAIGGIIIATLSYALGEHWYLFAAFLFCNILDYITGVFKSKVLKKESSSAGLLGIVKKLSYWCMIALAFLVGVVLNDMGEIIGTDLSSFTPAVGWLTLAMLAVNEIRSILENLVELNVPVPKFLINGLKVTADKIANVSDSLFDGSVDVNPNASEGDKVQVNIQTPTEQLKEKDTITLRIHTISDDGD